MSASQWREADGSADDVRDGALQALDCRNAVDFDIERAWPRRYMQKYARRRFAGKIARVDFVEDAEMGLFRRAIDIAF
jgi:hypothetical protein